MHSVVDVPDPLAGFSAPVRRWFEESFPAPTAPQVAAWGPILRGDNTLVFAPTGSGKTLAAFLGCLDRLTSRPPVVDNVDAADDDRGGRRGRREPPPRCRVLYVSPLKALASDVERNLQAPLVGIARCAGLLGVPVTIPSIAVRTGDTDVKARARFARESADILITTPESLSLLLTSRARAALRGVETVIVDEIHALVPTKRGAHLALSLARLEHLCRRPLQRIGLSATQRPLDEVARFLGGLRPGAGGRLEPAPVVIADARGDKRFVLTVEDTLVDPAAPPTAQVPGDPTATTTLRGTLQVIAPRLVELARTHRTTLVFANARRVAERLAAAVNDLAGEPLAAAHHGALARAQRQVVEEQLKQGQLKLLVATSSLELGVDLASVDLVVQVEAPPSVASALQRVGRAGHQVGAASVGRFMPRYPTDLIACAATVAAMREGAVEATHMTDNALDVLAQHVVGMVAMEPWTLDDLFDTVRRAAPWAALSRGSFDGVIALLSGQAAITHGAEGHEGLRGRILVDHARGVVVGRPFAQRLAVQNNGTIVDRGLYGVYLLSDDADNDHTGPRVGELDEEMVLETRPGEVFRLGASSWRMERITADKVLVSPAPGEPGKMPFWRGEELLRPLELGERMGALVREVATQPETTARSYLCSTCGFVDAAATRLLDLLVEQKARGGGVLPDDRTFVVERSRDELGDWQVCLLSPLGGRVLQPLGLVLREEAKRALGVEVALSVANDGLLLRFPEAVGDGAEQGPDVAAFFPDADALEALVLDGLAGSSIFAARFREAAGRALLLPKRRPGQRAPLWRQRQRARDLFAAVAQVADFPITLEAARETLKDVFDLPGLTGVIRELHAGTRRVVTVDVDRPSPMAAAVIAGFVQSALYEGDVPPAERRAQALSIDPAQLRALLGDGVLRELLDEDVIAEVEATLQRTADGLRAKSKDAVHDLLLRLGDLTPDEIAARVDGANDGGAARAGAFVDELVTARRAVRVKVGGRDAVLAVEDLGRYRDALGLVPPPGAAGAWLAPTTEPLPAIVRRFVRTHALVTAHDVAARFGLGLPEAMAALQVLIRRGEVVEGALRPGGRESDHACPEVLASIRRRTLTKLRREVAPVEPEALARHLVRWHGVTRPRPGADVVLDAIAALQGTALPLSSWEQTVLPARVAGFSPALLDALLAAGEVVWVGSGRGGAKEPAVMLFLADDLPRLWRPPPLDDDATALERTLLSLLRSRGASFFAELAAAAATQTPTTTLTLSGQPAPTFAAWQQARRGGSDPDVEEALWSLVARGQVGNDTLEPLRARAAGVVAGRAPSRRAVAARSVAFRSRRAQAPGTGGRWSALPLVDDDKGALTRRAAAVAEQLLRRDGVLTPAAVTAALGEGGLPVSTAAVRQALRMLEDAGKVRRGYFVADLGGLQTALPAAVESLRGGGRDRDAEGGDVVVLDAADPAQPCGLQLPWPTPTLPSSTLPQRQAGALVVLVEGRAVLLLLRGGKRLLSFLPVDEPDRSRLAAAATAALVAFTAKSGIVCNLESLDGASDAALPLHPLVPFLVQAGFVRGAGGYGPARRMPGARAPTHDDSGA